MLIAVESFISNIMVVGFEDAFKPVFKELLEQFEHIYDVDHHYSDYNAVFVALKLEIDSMRYDPFCNPNADNYDFVLQLKLEQLKEFEKQIKASKHRIHDELYQFAQQEKNNTESLEGYIGKLFHHYSKLLIVRVDLAYKNDSKGQINIEQFYKHFEKMRNRLSNKDTCFQYLHGYAWALEQSTENNGGYHAHLLLIYDGTKVQKGSYYAQRIGEKWQEITQGHGCYFNPHSKEYIHKLRMAGCEIGLGMVTRNKESDWEHLLSVINYLTLPEKDIQRLRVKAIKDMQTFGHGEFENTKRRGIKK
ncbi:YagK/YfjJ domain-containing protein [Acinetobacter sp. NigerLNRRAM0016]